MFTDCVEGCSEARSKSFSTKGFLSKLLQWSVAPLSWKKLPLTWKYSHLKINMVHRKSRQLKRKIIWTKSPWLSVQHVCFEGKLVQFFHCHFFFTCHLRADQAFIPSVAFLFGLGMHALGRKTLGDGTGSLEVSVHHKRKWTRIFCFGVGKLYRKYH